jgi:hypothetical protein
MNHLRFAYGESIGPLQEADLDLLVGPEHVAHLVEAGSVDRNQLSESIDVSTRTQDKDVEYFSQNLEALSVEDQMHDVGHSMEKLASKLTRMSVISGYQSTFFLRR